MVGFAWATVIKSTLVITLLALTKIFYVCCALGFYVLEDVAVSHCPMWLKPQAHLTMETVFLVSSIRWRGVWGAYAMACVARYHTWALPFADPYNVPIQLHLLLLSAWIFQWHRRQLMK